MSSPVFQHRHYKAVADILHGLEPVSGSDEAKEQWSNTVATFTRKFKADNFKFSSDRFLAAVNQSDDMHGKDKR